MSGSEVVTSSTALQVWPVWSCPEHGETLVAAKGKLECPRGHAYAVHDGIPRFVSGSTYADAFGAQWNRYRITQLDSYTGTTITRDRARGALGQALWSSLSGMLVLECGCGAGRFTEVLLEQGARVLSIDLSEAVDANQKNFPQGDRHLIAQADIARLPFEPRQFDLVLCLGVVQHTPSPEATIRRLYDHVRPGGTLVFDHYTSWLGWRLSLKPLYRALLRRLPPTVGLAVTEQLVGLLLPLHRRLAHTRLPRVMLNRVSPVMSYYRTYPQLPDDIQREWALLDTHDSLTDWHKHFRNCADVRRVLTQLGAERIECGPGSNGIDVRARRPAGTEPFQNEHAAAGR